MARALLIEDEPSARADLAAHLAAHPEVIIVGEAGTLEDSRALFTTADYDLVFLDVRLIGGNAFDLLPDLREGADVIFVTGHDEYALRAFEINALDYLLKPVDPARLAASLEKRAAARPAVALASGLLPDDVLFLRTNRGARFVPLADIALITARDNYSEVRCVDGSTSFVRKSLKSWLSILPADRFVRAHRTCIVNLAHVVAYERDADERTSLSISGVDAPVGVSRYRWADLQTRLWQLRRGV